MKLIFSLICGFLLITYPTLEQNRFEEEINKNYDKYSYVIEEETSIGDVVIVVGSIKNRMYISGFIYNSTKEMHIFEINDKTYNDCFYKLKAGDVCYITIKRENGGFFKEYEVYVPSVGEFKNMNVLTGEGKNDFPKEPVKIDLIDIFIATSFGFIGIIALFTIILTTLYRRRLGRFNENYLNDDEYVDFQYNSDDDVIEIDDTNYITEEKSKEDLAKEAYDDYNNGTK